MKSLCRRVQRLEARVRSRAGHVKPAGEETAKERTNAILGVISEALGWSWGMMRDPDGMSDQEVGRARLFIFLQDLCLERGLLQERHPHWGDAAIGYHALRAGLALIEG